METVIYLLMEDVKERYPAAKAAHDAEASERAARAREQLEMIENETAAGPTFYDCDRDGRRLDAAALVPTSKPAVRVQPTNAATAPDEASDSEGDAPSRPGPREERDIDFDE